MNLVVPDELVESARLSEVEPRELSRVPERALAIAPDLVDPALAPAPDAVDLLLGPRGPVNMRICHVFDGSTVGAHITWGMMARARSPPSSRRAGSA